MADDHLLDDDEEEQGGASWLMTFADMSTLLLTFFVLLLSFASFDKAQFAESFSSVREQFGGSQMLNVKSEIQIDREASSQRETVRERDKVLESQRLAYNEIRTFLTRNAEATEISATFDDGIITLTVPAEVLFAPGSEDLMPAAYPYLNALRELFLKERNQFINIKGYTDDTQVPRGMRYRDNWELSALRAVHVLQLMIEGGVEPFRLTATGLGDLEPIAPNTTEENRAKNRRVEFVLERRTWE